MQSRALASRYRIVGITLVFIGKRLLVELRGSAIIETGASTGRSIGERFDFLQETASISQPRRGRQCQNLCHGQGPHTSRNHAHPSASRGAHELRHASVRRPSGREPVRTHRQPTVSDASKAPERVPWYGARPSPCALGSNLVPAEMTGSSARCFSRIMTATAEWTRESGYFVGSPR